MKTLKRVTFQIRLDGLASPRRYKWQGAVREADSWRFDLNRLPPLEEAIQQLRREGDEEAAYRFQAFLDTLPPEVKAQREHREASGWRTVWVHPHEQTIEDIHFQLVLFLMQEGMIPFTQDLQTQALSYLKQFPGLSDDGTAYLVLDRLRRRFTEPEDWRALPKYIKQVVKEEIKKEKCERLIVGSDPEEAHEREVQHKLRGKPRPTRRGALSRYSIPAAVAQLSSEGFDVSVDTLYDWINTGKISSRLEQGRRWLDAKGLEQARERLQASGIRRCLREQLIQEGRTPEAVKKFIQRQLKAGKTLKELVRGFWERRSP